MPVVMSAHDESSLADMLSNIMYENLRPMDAAGRADCGRPRWPEKQTDPMWYLPAWYTVAFALLFDVVEERSFRLVAEKMARGYFDDLARANGRPTW